MLALVAGLLAFAYALRAIPLWLSPQGVGVDHWYWKTYIETYRRDRRFPPELPQYILDEAQWYPPLFPVIMARLPPALFDRWTHQLAIVIDLARMALLLGLAYWQSDGTLVVVAIAGLVYATTPIQVSYNVQLNPRGLAALMLDGLLMALLWSMYGGSWWAWACVVALGGLIVLTHKMTTQVFWFVMLATALIYRRWEIAVVVPASMAAAMLLSRGFYYKVLRAHWDIVRFWAKHWRWLGADPVRESPIYGEPGYQRSEKLHKRGLRGLVWHCFILFGFNPAAWIACLLVYERVFLRSSVLIYPTPFLIWLLLSCLFACVTTFIPVMKCLGAGYLYVYNTSVMASLILALTFQYTRAPQYSTPFVELALILNLLGLGVYGRQFIRNKRTRVDEHLDVVIQELGRRPRGVVMCLPTNWSEVIAYRTGYPVLWGGHGYGFNRMEPTYPRLLIPIREVVSRYNVRYLLTMNSVVNARFEADLPRATTLQRGEYRLYSFATDAVTENVAPAVAIAAAP